jgi:hypothetical protein
MSAAGKIEAAVAQPHQMAAVHDKAGLLEDDEYEYAMRTFISQCTQEALTTISHSYEGLPPNFSLAANMMAGAFAGIAV